MQRKHGEPGQVDPDLVVPRAVREAALRAEQSQKDAYGVSEPALTASLAAPAVPGSAPSPPDAVTSPSPAEGAPPHTLQPDLPQETPPKPIDWEAKYKTDFGRIEAERKRTREHVDQMSQRMQQLERQLVAHAPAPPVALPKDPVTPEELSDYGEDFINLIRRVADARLEQRIQPLAQEVGRTRAQIGVSQNRTMHQQMDALYPDWQKVNADEAFIQWTQLPDPYSGVTRQRLMQDAWDNGDAHRVFVFIQGFLAEEAALNPQGNGRQPASAPAAPPANGNGAPAAAPPLTLAQLAAPGGARSAPAIPADKPVYTAEDISKFFTDCAAGKWRNREADRARIEADIFQAQHEGRVITARRFTPPQPPRGMTQ